jgi:BTB/POZ domain-containing protein KCTD9
MLADVDASGLTIPRTFFSRSAIERCSFVDTDLSESNLCWNDFEETDFSHAVLRGADLRASEFMGCSFENADLSGADLRQSGFDDCSFKNAHLEGARLTDDQLNALELSREQRKSVVPEGPGDEPDGG